MRRKRRNIFFLAIRSIDPSLSSQPLLPLPSSFLQPHLSLPQAGAAITYMLDAAGARQATLLAAWATLAGANAGLLLTGAPTEGGARPLFLAALAAAFNAAALLATGCWATLQFRWVQRQHPAAVLSLEKGLLAASLPLGAAAGGLVCLTALSPAAAPFGTSACLFVLYFALCVPLRSSFVREERGGRDGEGKGRAKAGEVSEASSSSSSSSSSSLLAVSRSSALRGALLFLTLPTLQYYAMHRRLLLAHADVHGWALLLLVSFPAAVMASARRGLWFLESSRAAAKKSSPSARALARRAHRRLRRSLLLLSCAGTVAGLEGRVLLRSARQYLVLPAPWAGIALGAEERKVFGKSFLFRLPGFFSKRKRRKRTHLSTSLFPLSSQNRRRSGPISCFRGNARLGPFGRRRR